MQPDFENPVKKGQRQQVDDLIKRPYIGINQAGLAGIKIEIQTYNQV